MNTKFLHVSILVTLATTGCVSRHAADQEVIKPGVRYTAPLGSNLVAEIKVDQESHSIEIYIMREKEMIADFSAGDQQITSQIDLKTARGAKTINVFVKDGKLVNHTLVSSKDGEFIQMISDRDGDFFPDEQVNFDWATEKKTRQVITHVFAPFPEKK